MDTSNNFFALKLQNIFLGEGIIRVIHKAKINKIILWRLKYQKVGKLF